MVYRKYKRNIIECLYGKNSEGISISTLAELLRSSLSGDNITPDVVDVLFILGKEKSLFRLNKFVEKFSQNTEEISYEI